MADAKEGIYSVYNFISFNSCMLSKMEQELKDFDKRNQKPLPKIIYQWRKQWIKSIEKVEKAKSKQRKVV